MRPIISVSDCFQKRETNLQQLNKFNVVLLESCAEFLGFSLADQDNFKIYTKPTLVNRIYLASMALMPAKCGECSDSYTIDHDPEHPPFFNCFRCFKGSHDCNRNKELHQTLSAMNTPSGFVWLCDTCHGIIDPIDPRRQRSRHASTSGSSTPQGNQADGAGRWKLADLTAHVEEKRQRGQLFPFIAITETWLKSYVTDTTMMLSSKSRVTLLHDLTAARGTVVVCYSTHCHPSQCQQQKCMTMAFVRGSAMSTHLRNY